MRYVNLLPGDVAPSFIQKTTVNPRYVFDVAAGRYLVLCFFGSASNETMRSMIAEVGSWTHIFDDTFATFFGVTIDPSDETMARLPTNAPIHRNVLDFDLSVSKAYGAASLESEAGKKSVTLRRQWVIIDPAMRVLKTIQIDPEIDHLGELKSFLEAQPRPGIINGIEVQAPVLYLANIFEPELCERLIDCYRTNGGKESGFMREIDGKTVAQFDYSHKRRRDFTIEDDALIQTLQGRVHRRLVPQIQKAFQFNATRMERYIVACYSEADGGHFRPHRDNTTKGTAHRRFAVSINLNSEFEGGEISFPEYGPRRFKPPPGGAVVFSCSLLHTVSKVTGGQRFAFLPFLYDDAAAEIRRQNNAFLDPSVGQYKA